MIIKLKQKTWTEVNVKVRFAFFPLQTFHSEIVWLERYYIYENCRSIWKAPKKYYMNKQDFYNRVVEGGRKND